MGTVIIPPPTGPALPPIPVGYDPDFSYDPENEPNDDLETVRIGGRKRVRLVVRPYEYQTPLVRTQLPARFNFSSWGNKAGKTSTMIMRMARLLWEEDEKIYRWIAPFSRVWYS